MGRELYGLEGDMKKESKIEKAGKKKEEDTRKELRIRS